VNVNYPEVYRAIQEEKERDAIFKPFPRINGPKEVRACAPQKEVFRQSSDPYQGEGA
jgi:hypothetical protein